MSEMQFKNPESTDFINFVMALASSVIVLIAIALSALLFFNAQFILEKFVYFQTFIPTFVYRSKKKAMNLVALNKSSK
jgi:hypothetical protein